MKFVKMFGFSADKMAAQLREKGRKVDEKPEGFIVEGRSGPLAEGEPERAASWGKDLARKYGAAQAPGARQPKPRAILFEG